MVSTMTYKTLGYGESTMANSEWSLQAAWKNGQLTSDGLDGCPNQLLFHVQELESELGSVEEAVKGYLDAVSNYCSAGSLLSSAYSKSLRGTTLSKISQQYQQATEQLENSAHQSVVDISNCVLSTLCDFRSTLPGIKQEIETYRRCKDHYEKCREGLESFAGKDASASEGKRFQNAKERFHSADKECSRQVEKLGQCLNSLEGNRVKMVGASLLSLLHTLAKFCGNSSATLAPLGEYQSVGNYLQDREIAPQLKEATAAWCSITQSYHSVRESKYLSGEQVFNLLEYRKGQELDPSTKEDLAEHLKQLLESYKKEVEDIEHGPVVVPGGFFKNPAGIGLALKGCCSKLEILALGGIKEPASLGDMVTTLKCEIPKVDLEVGSDAKSWHRVSNLKDSDPVLSRQHCIQDLIEPIAKQFDIPFTKESLKSFTLTVLNEACSIKAILASKIAVQLMYGKTDLVVVKLSPESAKSRAVRINCEQTNVNIEVQLTWWVTCDHTLFSGILDDDDENEPLFKVDTTYSTMINYMDYLEEKESRLPSILVDFSQANISRDGWREGGRDLQTRTACSACKNQCPIPPPRKKHNARKKANRQKTEIKNGISTSGESTDEKKSSASSEKEKDRYWFSPPTKQPSHEPFPGTISTLSLASETELDEVINFLSGSRLRGILDANDGDTESLFSVKAMSDSGIESVKNARVGGKTNNGGDPTSVEGQTKGKKGKKKDKKGAKNENTSKRKKKRRGDKAKKDKKKAANAAADEPEGTGAKDTTVDKIESNDKSKDTVLAEVDKRTEETELGSESKVSDAVADSANVPNPEEPGQEGVKLFESLRNVWELGEDAVQQPDPAPPSSLPIQAAGQAKQSAATYGSQDSVYFSCWSLPSLTNETEDPKSVKGVNPDLFSELNLGLGWSKGYEGDPSSGRRIWSPPLSKPDDYSQKASWSPSIARQDGVDPEGTGPPPVMRESVFSFGLDITGLDLVAATKQDGAGTSRLNDGRNEMLSSLNDQKMTASQPSIWTHGNLTAGQFSEKSSCGEGLHHPHETLQERVRLQTHHSDSFVGKDISLTPLATPMYMNIRYNPNLISPFPVEAVPGPYGCAQQKRSNPRSNHCLSEMDRRRTSPRFYGPLDRSRAGPL